MWRSPTGTASGSPPAAAVASAVVHVPMPGSRCSHSVASVAGMPSSRSIRSAYFAAHAQDPGPAPLDPRPVEVVVGEPKQRLRRGKGVRRADRDGRAVVVAQVPSARAGVGGDHSLTDRRHRDRLVPTTGRADPHGPELLAQGPHGRVVGAEVGRVVGGAEEGGESGERPVGARPPAVGPDQPRAGPEGDDGTSLRGLRRPPVDALAAADRLRAHDREADVQRIRGPEGHRRRGLGRRRAHPVIMPRAGATGNGAAISRGGRAGRRRSTRRVRRARDRSVRRDPTRSPPRPSSPGCWCRGNRRPRRGRRRTRPAPG